MSTPTSLASDASLTTIALAPNAAALPALCGHASGKTGGRRSPVYVASPESGRETPTSVAADGKGRDAR
jgi:hypothetical protein